MYKINDYVIYKRDVCIINSIKEKFMKNEDYYCISPISDKSLTINVPVNSNLLRDMISKERALEIISNIPSISAIDSNDKSLENIYKELLNTEDELDLVRIIKTTYLRNKDRVDHGKKIGDKDDTYFKKAESCLYNLLRIPLNMSYDECKNFIIESLSNNKE